MPSGKTHDLVTVLLAAPTFAGVYWWTQGNWKLAALAVCGMLFGGFMFGPDLDIHSRQYTRWGLARFIWYPYKVAFGHRSRLSHGIVFSTLIRLVYFALVLFILAWAVIYLYIALFGGTTPTLKQITNSAREMLPGIIYIFRQPMTLAVLFGIWWGATTHTLADVGTSIFRKGSQLF